MKRSHRQSASTQHLVEPVDTHTDQAEQSTSHVLFWLEWPDDRRYAAVHGVERFKLTTLLKTHREREILPFGIRSKCIVVPWGVNQMGTHEVNVFSRTGTKLFVDEIYALLHHYRVDMDGGVKNTYLTDRAYSYGGLCQGNNPTGMAPTS